MIERSIIDPRTIVILGDSETALSAVDALRTSFSGKIVLVATSAYG
jgi:lactam utilization protein B